MKKVVLAILLGLVAMAPLMLIWSFYPLEETPIASLDFRQNKNMEPGVELVVKAIKVIDGFRFDMYTESGRIEAHLPVAAKEEAGEFVVGLLNKTTPPAPTVTLRRQVGTYWIVDFHLQVDGGRSSVVDLLRAKGLLLQ